MGELTTLDAHDPDIDIPSRDLFIEREGPLLVTEGTQLDEVVHHRGVSLGGGLLGFSLARIGDRGIRGDRLGGRVRLVPGHGLHDTGRRVPRRGERARVRDPLLGQLPRVGPTVIPLQSLQIPPGGSVVSHGP